jgi:hypothetical protein
VSQLAVDLGTVVTKVAVANGGPEPTVLTQPARAQAAWASASTLGARGDALAAALTLAGTAMPGTGPAGSVTLAVPDQWLKGTAEGGRRQEELRHVAEDELGLRAVSWTGQLAAVAALTASQRGRADAGLYLVCDIGGRGVRAAACEVAGRSVRQRAVRAATSGGWQDFEAAVHATLGGAVPGLAADWYLTAMEQDRRSRMVLDRAVGDPEFRDARAYTLGGFHELTAGQVIDCFGPTAQRVRECAGSVLAGEKPLVAVLTGGLAWLPLAARVLREVAGTEPVILGPDAAARGALLLATGPPGEPEDLGLPPVSLPVNEVRDGLLAEASLPLPWTGSFAPEGDGSLVITEQSLTLDIGGRRVTLPVPGLVAGSYRIGARPGWSGTGLLVLRANPPRGGTVPRDDVHVVPLETQEASR